ncbi:hypothetical protein LNV23_18125 [Paucibacter sp. DJ1R-11]|uniref:hypothetical protein n=1 Tax=Paucibacter sp. DJ1R-11 TaxID=2893556 RepID=UPI0021E472D2|nr:hypothetical protein [Paucibacter sp. DJ1R-11]MCV2365368.1 hypothetical protein [Paucibacter sp. DJ1R-11]
MKPSSAAQLVLTLGLTLALSLSSAQAEVSAAERPRWRTLGTGQFGDLKVGMLQERLTGYVAPQLLAGWPAAIMQRFNAARAQELRAQVREDLADPTLSLEDTGHRRLEWFSRDWLVWWNYTWTAYRDQPHPGVSVSSRVFDLRTGAEVDVLTTWFEDSPELDRLLVHELRSPGKGALRGGCEFFEQSPDAALYTRNEAGRQILRVSIRAGSLPTSSDEVLLVPTRRGLALRTDGWAEPSRTCRGEDLALISWARLRPFMKPELQALFSTQGRRLRESSLRAQSR